MWMSHHQVQAAMIPALQGQPWNYCISCGSPVMLSEKWVPAAYLLNLYLQSLLFVFGFKYAEDFEIFKTL